MKYSCLSKIKIPFLLISAFIILTFNSCKFLDNACFDICPISYGEIKVESGVSGAKRITVGMGNLSEDFSKLIKNHVVLTTTEYPDNAPPYTENTTVTPLSTDFDFLVPSTDSNRKPFLLSPDIIYGITFDVLPKTSPAKLLYLYLIKEQGTTYISSDLPHITVDLNKYPVK